MVYLLGAGDFALGNPALELFNVMFAFMNALSLYYLYFRAETSSHHQHALRRNKWTGIFWGLLHVPVVVFIAVVSVCFYQIGKLAKAKNLSPLPFSLQSIFGTCYAALFFCFCAFSLIHLDADPQSNRQKVRPHIIRKGLRVVVNFIIGVLFLVLGLSVQISAQSWIYVSSGLCVFAAAVEEVGRIKK
jgi:low temperature requirement protein LtrA